jgi:hypothetical protein
MHFFIFPHLFIYLCRSEGHYVFSDCFFIFRALCKLSLRDLPKEYESSFFIEIRLKFFFLLLLFLFSIICSVDPNSIDLRSKLLSLELLHFLIENSGPVFRSFDKFINMAIKKVKKKIFT